MKLRYIAAIVMAAPAFYAFPQDVALKSNLLSDVCLSPDLGIEVGLAPRWTIGLTGNVMAWNINHHRLRHWALLPQVDYWLCERFQGHHFNLHLIGGQFNVGNLGHNFPILGFDDLASRRYQGWMGGAGVGYGYSWILGKHWNIDAEIGAGWIYTRSDVYPCADCGNRLQQGKVHNYVGLTKLGVNLVYLF